MNVKEELPEENKNNGNEMNKILMAKIEELSSQMAMMKSQGMPQVAAVDNESLLKGLTDAFTKAIEKAGGKQESISYEELKYKTVTQGQINIEDVMETPVVFYAHNCGYLIVDDSKHGQSVRAPYKPIMFEFHFNKLTGKGKEQDIINYSKYVCSSKLEYEFLKSHTFFNIIFFESRKDLEAVDYRMTQKVIKNMTSLKNMAPYKIIEVARQNGIDINGAADDLDKLRLTVATVLAKREMDSEGRNVRITEDEGIRETYLQR